MRALRTLPCPHCGRAVDRLLHFCSHCGLKTGFGDVHPVFCHACGTRSPGDDAAFCPVCGQSLGEGTALPAPEGDTQPRGAMPVPPTEPGKPSLVLLNDAGDAVRQIPIEREQTVVGRTQGDVKFIDDDAVSPEHAILTWRENSLLVRDLGSANGTWVFISAPHVLADGDVLLVGSQVIRFRRLPAHDEPPPGPRQTGSRLPVRDDAMLEQLRADGSVRDVLYLSPGRTILTGREHGDWVFPYDPTMSARHAEVRSFPEREEYVVRDLGSRNGVALLVRGEREVQMGERLLLGRKVLRAERT